jgi:P-type Mg2+ transporter
VSRPGLDTPYWSQDAATLTAALGAGPGRPFVGASRRHASRDRPNSVEDVSHPSAIRLLLRQFEGPLVLILIFAGAVSLVLQQ